MSSSSESSSPLSRSSLSEHSAIQPTVRQMYPKKTRRGTLAEHIDNPDFLSNVVDDVDETAMQLFLDALDSRPFHTTSHGGEFGSMLYENVRTGSVHVILFDDDPILMFNAFTSSKAAMAATREFETLYPEDRVRYDFLWRLSGGKEADDPPELESEWDAFLQRHRAGKYNPGYVSGDMVDLFTWA
jgi:hypothetical protein